MIKRASRTALNTAGLALGGLAMLFVSPLAHAAKQLPSPEEMWRIIQEQQERIEVLERELQGARAPSPQPQAQPAQARPPAPAGTEQLQRQQQRLEALEQRLEQTEQAIEATAASVEEAALARGGWWDRTSIGGYGELHYNGGKKDEIDFHRNVIFVGYEFTDWIRFYSEWDFEHAVTGDGEAGELELEQAFLEFDLTDRAYGQAGVFLIPAGILNERHEPPTFFGVERNPVETNIIPTTWFEGGGQLVGDLGGGFSANLAVHSGLDTPTAGGNAFRIRSGRQKVSEADAENFAYTGRLRWSGFPGVEIAATGQYQEDVTQGALDVDGTLFAVHTDSRRGPWGLRALFARWDLFGDEPEAFGRDVQYGWYVEPSYRFDTRLGEFGVFARYNQWDNEAGSDDDSDFEQIDLGVSYWPHPNVVFKADYQFQDAPAERDADDRVNLGIGYWF